MLKHVGNKWYVLDSSGKKVLGKHQSKKKAVAQLSAIEISKKEKMEGIFPSFSLFLDEEIQTTLEYHKTLNQKLWNGFDLKPEVRSKLLEIGDAWANWAGIPTEAIADMILVGGNGNFNYTPKSDIDLHLLIDLDAIENCPSYIDDYLKDKKQLWALTHNITIYGQDVELYAQDKSVAYTLGQGVYSIKNNKWLVHPEKSCPKLDDPAVASKVDN